METVRGAGGVARQICLKICLRLCLRQDQGQQNSSNRVSEDKPEGETVRAHAHPISMKASRINI